MTSGNKYTSSVIFWRGKGHSRDMNLNESSWIAMNIAVLITLQLHSGVHPWCWYGRSVLLKDTSVEQMFALMGLTWTKKKKPIGWKHSTLLPDEETWIAASSERRGRYSCSARDSVGFKGSRVQDPAKLPLLSDASVLFSNSWARWWISTNESAAISPVGAGQRLPEGVRVTEISSPVLGDMKQLKWTKQILNWQSDRKTLHSTASPSEIHNVSQ